jgi:hypothetical protein
MSITPIQYLLLENISVCYSPYYIAKAFLQQEIAKVTEIRTNFNDDESILGEDPVFWYDKCKQNVLLQVEWMDTEAAYQFIQTIRDLQIIVETPWYEDDEPPKRAYVYPTETISQPWVVSEGNFREFCYENPKHTIWVNPDFQERIDQDQDQYQDQDKYYDEDYDANDTPATIIGKARTRYMMERAQIFGEEDDFERRMDDDDE